MRAAFIVNQTKELLQLVEWFKVEIGGDSCDTCNKAIDETIDDLRDLVHRLGKVELCRPPDVALPGQYVFDSASDKQDPTIIRGIRPNMLQSLMRYVQTGQQPGDFLCALLDNNLREAVTRADEENRHSLHNFCLLMYNYFPSLAWGSKEKREKWQEIGGLQGLR